MMCRSPANIAAEVLNQSSCGHKGPFGSTGQAPFRPLQIVVALRLSLQVVESVQ